MDEYEQFEAECEKRREVNHTFIIGFTRYLQNKNISKKTVDKHVANIDFYINECLLYERPEKAADGVNQVNYFLGYWFIRKAMWASPTSIKEVISPKLVVTYIKNILDRSLRYLPIKELGNDSRRLNIRVIPEGFYRGSSSCFTTTFGEVTQI